MGNDGGGSRGLPGGVVTFVFTDIEGSTALFRALGDAYPPLLAAHNEILRDVWERHDGAEVKTEGDAFFVAFADPTSAIAASVDAVEALAAHDWPTDATIKARVGMHTGVGYPEDGDYVAYPVHQAARIGGVGHGGQVVISPETAELAGDLGDIRLHDLGSFRVRDFDQAIHLFQAERSAAPTAFAPLRTKADVAHNLPADLPTAHGRDADVAGIAEQLSQSRAVSIVGPGGVGKTLLAQTVAFAEAANRPDGAWFVDLAPHRDGSTMRGAIADALDVAADELDAHLADRELLLVLDNAEQATADVARLLVELLGKAPKLSVLVTSREPLAIAAERVWRLDLMDSDSAVAVFIERAEAVAPGFDSDAQRAEIAELCRRLDGLPLAIELAAARVTAMSVSEITSSLDDRLRVLRSRRRDLDDRQRTATGLVDWSYQLLDQDEQLVFRRLAPFVGGFDLDAVTAAAEDSGLDRIDVSDIVWSLVEKSLVLPVIGDGSTRYRVLETLRAFGRQAMIEADELDSTHRQIAGWYRARFDPTVAFTPEQARMIRDELATMRALVDDLSVSDPSLAQWLMWPMGLHHKSTDPARGVAELSPLVEALTVPGEAVVAMLAIVAHLINTTNDLDGAEALLAKAAEFGGPGTVGWGWTQNVAALNAIKRGDLDDALRLVDQAIPQSVELAQISLINTRGIVEAELGDLDASAQSFAQVLELATTHGALDAEVVSSMAVAEIAQRRGDRSLALEQTAHVLRLAESSGMRAQVALLMIGAARLLAELGDHGEAVTLHGAGDMLLAETGQHLFAGDVELSAQMFREATDAIGEEAVMRARSAGGGLSELEAFERAMTALDAAVALSSIA